MEDEASAEESLHQLSRGALSEGFEEGGREQVGCGHLCKEFFLEIIK